MQALLIASAIDLRANTTNYKPRLSRVRAAGSTVEHGVVVLANHSLLIPDAPIASMSLRIPSTKSLSLRVRHDGQIRHLLDQIGCDIDGLILVKGISVAIL
jgi:hypothetical protein